MNLKTIEVKICSTELLTSESFEFISDQETFFEKEEESKFWIINKMVNNWEHQNIKIMRYNWEDDNEGLENYQILTKGTKIY